MILNLQGSELSFAKHYGPDMTLNSQISPNSKSEKLNLRHGWLEAALPIDHPMANSRGGKAGPSGVGLFCQVGFLYGNPLRVPCKVVFLVQLNLVPLCQVRLKGGG